jgi:hypothetical protein
MTRRQKATQLSRQHRFTIRDAYYLNSLYGGALGHVTGSSCVRGFRPITVGIVQNVGRAVLAGA